MTFVELLNDTLMGKLVKLTHDRANLFDSKNPQHCKEGFSVHTVLDVVQRLNGIEIRFYDLDARQGWGIPVSLTDKIEMSE